MPTDTTTEQTPRAEAIALRDNVLAYASDPCTLDKSARIIQHAIAHARADERRKAIGEAAERLRVNSETLYGIAKNEKRRKDREYKMNTAAVISSCAAAIRALLPQPHHQATAGGADFEMDADKT